MEAFRTIICGEPLLDTIISVDELPTSVPIRTTNVGKLSLEDMQQVLANVQPDMAWQGHKHWAEISSFTAFDPAHYANLQPEIASLLQRSGVQVGRHVSGQEYLYHEGQLITRPIEINKKDCRFEDPEVIDDIVFRYGATDVTRTSGGTGMNTGLGLAELGHSVTYHGKCGADEYAQQYIKGALKAGVDIRLVEVPTESTGHCLALITPDGERTMLTHLGAAATMTADDLKEEWFEGQHMTHMEGYRAFCPGFLQKTTEYARKHNVQTSLSLGSETVVKINQEQFLGLIRSGQIDVLVGNKKEMRTLTGKHDLLEIAQDLSQHCKTVVITMGKRGSMIKQGDADPVTCAAVKVHKVDGTGAGDLHTAGLWHGLLNEYSPETCATLGNIAAAAVLTDHSAQVPDWSTVKKQMHRAIQK